MPLTTCELGAVVGLAVAAPGSDLVVLAEGVLCRSQKNTPHTGIASVLCKQAELVYCSRGTVST